MIKWKQKQSSKKHVYMLYIYVYTYIFVGIYTFAKNSIGQNRSLIIIYIWFSGIISVSAILTSSFPSTASCPFTTTILLQNQEKKMNKIKFFPQLESILPWISILYMDWFYAFCRLSNKGQNLFGILVSSLQLNTFIIIVSLDIYNILDYPWPVGSN